jgi:hypothetical protein
VRQRTAENRSLTKDCRILARPFRKRARLSSHMAEERGR